MSTSRRLRHRRAHLGRQQLLDGEELEKLVAARKKYFSLVPVTFAKTGVRSLLVTDAERDRSHALADARAYAQDILRSALGPFWRWQAPLLLRRQLRSGRLPASVMTAVETCDAARWERSVETWITAAVVLPERFAGVLAAARAEASQSAPAAPAWPRLRTDSGVAFRCITRCCSVRGTACSASSGVMEAKRGQSGGIFGSDTNGRHP